jgi:hypothetical protein
VTAPSATIGIFAASQPRCAAVGIPTFPVHIDPDGKKPMVSNYAKFGLRGSAELVRKFGTATGIGFMAGERSRISVVDIDTRNETVLVDALDRHGQTPIIARTGSGKFHAYYRHNGEHRMIPEKDHPIDILGGGIVIAPPSRGLTGNYQFIAGGLDDLDRLPVMQNAPRTRTSRPSLETRERRTIEPGKRNNRLFKLCLRAAHCCDDFDALCHVALTRNAEFLPPLGDEEVMKVAASAWGYQVEGRNYSGGRRAVLSEADVIPLMPDPYVGILIVWARARFKPDAEFWLADGLAAVFGWSLRQLRQARCRAIEIGAFRRIRPSGYGRPALYSFGTCSPKTSRDSQQTPAPSFVSPSQSST